MSHRSAPARDPPVEYIGPAWFGPAYERMMAHDPHAPGSVDRELIATAVGLCSETEAYLYDGFTAREAGYRIGTRPGLEGIARTIVRAVVGTEEKVGAIARYTAALADAAPSSLADLRFGGTEEEIIARGSDWCADVARVAIALLATSGIPARMVLLADLQRAYSGHNVVEAYRSGRWGCLDPRSGVVYLDEEGRPATTWDLTNFPRLILRHYRGRRTPYSRVGQFRRSAVANYRVGPPDPAAHRVTALNAYYRSILRMADRGWPGGLRWLHGEDRIAAGGAGRSPAPAPGDR